MHRAVALSLKKENVELICCDNGQDGFRLALEHRPLVVLADLDMPGLTGIELCQAIKNEPNLKNTRVILLCGSFDQVDEGRLESVPADGRLWKPFESHILITLIQRLLDQGNKPREMAEATSLGTTQPGVKKMPPPPPPGQIPKSILEQATHDLTADMTRETFQGLNEPVVKENLWNTEAASPKISEEATAPLAKIQKKSQTPEEDLSHFRTSSKEDDIARLKALRSQERVERTQAVPTPQVNENQIRSIVKEEIEKAINGWFKKKLQEKLNQVMAEIDSEG